MCLSTEIQQQKEALEATVIKWREYKEEYERLSDWLQQIDILVKAHKTALLASVPEKAKQVGEVKVTSPFFDVSFIRKNFSHSGFLSSGYTEAARRRIRSNGAVQRHGFDFAYLAS